MEAASIVIPVFNEAESLPELLTEIHNEIQPIIKKLELVILNDCSTDNTLEVLELCKDKIPYLKVLSNSVNQGQGESLLRAMKEAKYDILITMDGDLQVDPKEVIRLVKIYERSEVDFLCTKRGRRADDYITKDLPSHVGNLIFSLVFGTKFTDIGSSLKIIKKEHILDLSGFRNIHRYLSIILHYRRCTFKEIVILDRKRKYGKSNYALSKFLGAIFEIIYLKKYLRQL